MASGKSDLRSCIAWASFPSATLMSIPNFRPFRIVVSALNVRSMKRFSITFADSTRSRAVFTTSRAWSNSPWRTCSFAFRQLLSDVRLQEPEAPIDAPRERGPRALDLSLLEGDLSFLEELLELRRVGADFVRGLQEFLSPVPDFLRLLQEDSEVGD